MGAFTFAPGFNLRTIDRDGTPWFVAKDVCDVLDMPKVDRAVSGLLPMEKTIAKASEFEGLPNRGAIVISESGLYALIMRSRKPEAQAFRQWVTGTVLPDVRHKNPRGHRMSPRADFPPMPPLGSTTAAVDGQCGP